MKGGRNRGVGGNREGEKDRERKGWREGKQVCFWALR